MAASAAGRMNLAALQQQDPYITHIVDTATQVALYSFNPGANEWEKTDVEGTLFVYARSASPSNGFTIMNRLSMENLTEPITKDLEFQVNDPFLLYRNTKGASIYGIWFYDKDECARIGEIMHRMTQIQEDVEGSTAGGTDAKSTTSSEQSNPIDIMQMLSKAQSDYQKGSGDSYKSSSDTGSVSSASLGAEQGEDKTQTDIMSLLSKAQDEYTKAQQTPKKEEPKHMTKAPPANAVVPTSNIVKPVPVKANTPSPKKKEKQSQDQPAQRKQMKQKQQPEEYQFHYKEPQNPLPPAHVETGARDDYSRHLAAGGGLEQSGLLLQRLMANPGATSVQSLEQGIITDAQKASAVGQPDDEKLSQALLQKLQVVQQQRDFVSQPVAIPTSASQQQQQQQQQQQPSLPLSPGKFQMGGAQPNPVILPAPTNMMGIPQSPGGVGKPSMPQNVQQQLSSGNALLQGLAGMQSGVVTSPSQGRHHTASLPGGSTKQASTALLSPMVFQSTSSQPRQPSHPSNQAISMSTAAASLPSNQALGGVSHMYGTVSPLSKMAAQSVIHQQQTQQAHQFVPQLTKEQLKQSIIMLLQTDDEFVNKIHAAYLMSVSKT